MQRGSATTAIMSRRHDREWWMKEEKGQCEEQGIYQRTTCNASANQSMASITPTHPSRSPTCPTCRSREFTPVPCRHSPRTPVLYEFCSSPPVHLFSRGPI